MLNILTTGLSLSKLPHPIIIRDDVIIAPIQYKITHYTHQLKVEIAMYVFKK